MPDINISISANSVAWYAAIVATISALIAVLNYLNDKRRLKVSISRGFLTGVGDDSTKLFLKAANIGKRPVTVNGVGFNLKGKTDITLMHTPMLNLPYTIKEGNSCQTWIEHEEFLMQLKQDGDTIQDITHIWFRDSTGKIYKKRAKLKW